MRRRPFLALCGSLVAGAGCVSGPGTGDGTPDATGTDATTRSPGTDRTTTGTGTATGTDGPSVDVRSATVQPGVVGPNSPDSIGVSDGAGQYLVLDVAVTDGNPPARSAFAVTFDGESHAPREGRRGLYREGTWAARYENGEGPLAFPLPETGDAGDAALAWPGGERALSETVRTRLANPLPEFSVAFDGPERVGPDETPTLSLGVTNAGERTGRYVLALNRTGPRIAYTPLRRPTGVLDPGETDVIEFEGKSPYLADPPNEVTYRLDAPGRDHDDSLTVEPATTPTSTPTVTPTDG